MAIKAAMWVHGNTAVPQFVGGISVTSPGTPPHQTQQVNGQPWTDIVGLPQGPGKLFRGQAGDNWFHFAIPTPVIVDDARLHLERVFVLYFSDPDVQVDEVMVFDGKHPRFTSSMPTGISGAHDDFPLEENINMWSLPDRPEVLFGITIAVHVRFSREENITFVSAGADFSV